MRTIEETAAYIVETFAIMQMSRASGDDVIAAITKILSGMSAVAERQRADALAEALRTAVYYAIVEDTSLHMAQAVMMGAPLPDNIAWPSWVVSGRAALAAYDAEGRS